MYLPETKVPLPVKMDGFAPTVMSGSSDNPIDESRAFPLAPDDNASLNFARFVLG